MLVRGLAKPVEQKCTPKTDNSNDIEIIDTPLLWCGDLTLSMVIFYVSIYREYQYTKNQKLKENCVFLLTQIKIFIAKVGF